MVDQVLFVPAIID